RGAGVVPAHLRRRALRHRNRCRLRGTVLPARPACPGGLRRVSPHAFSLTSRAAVPLNWPTIPSPSAGAVVRRGGTRHTKETLVATTNDLKNGMVLKMDNGLWQVLEFQHVKPGKGPAFVRTKMKNVTSGKIIDKTFNAGTKVETATVDRSDFQYLYNGGTDVIFMDE